MSSGLEKRRSGFDRAEVEINVNLASMGPYYLSKLTNISIGGAFIQHPNPEAVGTLLTITFELPNADQPIHAKAKVAWKYVQGQKSFPNGTGMGVEFTEIDIEDRRKIIDYIQNILNPDVETSEIKPFDLPQEKNIL